jgi:hypothetical protein
MEVPVGRLLAPKPRLLLLSPSEMVALEVKAQPVVPAAVALAVLLVLVRLSPSRSRSAGSPTLRSVASP